MMTGEAFNDPCSSINITFAEGTPSAEQRKIYNDMMRKCRAQHPDPTHRVGPGGENPDIYTVSPSGTGTDVAPCGKVPGPECHCETCPIAHPELGFMQYFYSNGQMQPLGWVALIAGAYYFFKKRR